MTAPMLSAVPQTSERLLPLDIADDASELIFKCRSILSLLPLAARHGDEVLEAASDGAAWAARDMLDKLSDLLKLEGGVHPFQDSPAPWEPREKLGG